MFGAADLDALGDDNDVVALVDVEYAEKAFDFGVRKQVQLRGRCQVYRVD